MSKAVFLELYAFLLSQRGQADPFTVTLPGHTAPQGTWGGTPVANGADQVGRILNLRGFTVSQLNAVKAGDILSIAGQPKVYMATANAASDAAGIVALTIEPALVASPVDGAAITSTNVQFTVTRASDTLPSDISAAFVYNLDVDMIETL